MPRSTELRDGSTRVHVVAGILRDPEGRILIADRTRSRSLTNHWEFPGGKVDCGETMESALHRELVEELGIEIGDLQHFHYIEHDYPDLKVAIDFFLVSEWQGNPDGREGQQLRWVESSALSGAMLLPADTPVIEALAQMNRG